MTTFYVTCDASIVRPDLPARPIMLSASSFERLGSKRGRPGYLPPARVPPQVTEIAVDPGGFQAQMRYRGYRFSWETYIQWLYQLGPRVAWAAFPDLPCEQELAADADQVRARQERTLEYAAQLWRSPSCTDQLDGYRAQPWSWVPTVQGRTIDQYVWMAEQLEPLWRSQVFQYEVMARITGQLRLNEPETDRRTRIEAEWAARCASFMRIGIGSLCRRERAQEVVDIVRAVAQVLPTARFHLWGVKLDALGALLAAGLLDIVASTDSSAWNRRFGRDIDRINREQLTLGMSQRAFAVQVSLPRYLARVDRALSLPRQGRLPV